MVLDEARPDQVAREYAMSDLTIIKFEVLGMLFSPFAALGLVAC
jgi:hypothetical protein